MVPDNDKWRNGVNTFQGYVTRALQQNDSDMKEIKASILRIETNNRNTNARVAGIGATVSIIVTLIITVVIPSLM